VRIVIDTNVMVSAAFFGGAPKEVLSLWLDAGKVDVAVSPAIIDEYRRILSAFDLRHGGDIAEPLVQAIVAHAVVVDPVGKETYSRDPDDDKFIHCAQSANAVYIVSGDKDLLTLKNVDDIRIVTAREFLNEFAR